MFSGKSIFAKNCCFQRALSLLYPYFKTDKNIDDYYGRIARSVDTTLMRDLPAAEKIEYETLGKLRKLLYIMSTDVPFSLNVQSLSRKIQVSRNTLIRMFELLDKGAILRSSIAVGALRSLSPNLKKYYLTTLT